MTCIRMRARLASALVLAPAAAIALAGCSEDSEPAPEPTPSAQAAIPSPSEPRSLVAADFSELELGPKIEGPLGPEVEGSIIVGDRSIGNIESYVACPAGFAECDPDDLPEDTVYTYVHIVTPGVDEPNDPPFLRPVGLDEVTSASLFATTRRATGFTGSIGYDQAQARAALGPDGVIRVQDDNGTLAWRLVGGENWGSGEPITFFWQSTVPPAGPDEVFSLRADDKVARASGPFPAPAEDADDQD